MLNHNAAYEAVAAGYPNCISSMFIAECNIWSRNICWIIDPRDFTIGFYSVTIDPVLAKTKTAMCPPWATLLWRLRLLCCIVIRFAPLFWFARGCNRTTTISAKVVNGVCYGHTADAFKCLYSVPHVCIFARVFAAGS